VAREVDTRRRLALAVVPHRPGYPHRGPATTSGGPSRPRRRLSAPKRIGFSYRSPATLRPESFGASEWLPSGIIERFAI
jgi:hypothetical protein